MIPVGHLRWQRIQKTRVLGIGDIKHHAVETRIAVWKRRRNLPTVLRLGALSRPQPAILPAGWNRARSHHAVRPGVLAAVGIRVEPVPLRPARTQGERALGHIGHRDGEGPHGHLRVLRDSRVGGEVPNHRDILRPSRGIAPLRRQHKQACEPVLAVRHNELNRTVISCAVALGVHDPISRQTNRLPFRTALCLHLEEDPRSPATDLVAPAAECQVEMDVGGCGVTGRNPHIAGPRHVQRPRRPGAK